MSQVVENMKIWNQVEATPASYVSELQGKGFNALSSNPMYLTKIATKMFGPMGKGWGTNPLSEETEVIGDTHLYHLRLELWYVLDGETFRVNHRSSIKVAYPTSKGKYIIDEEARKKCQTNAMSKCLSLLGFSADIWLKYYDSPAYLEAREREADRENVAMELKDKYRAIIQTLENKCLCHSDEDKETLCQWVMNKPDLCLGEMQIVPGVVEQVNAAMKEAKESGTEPHQMLEEAKKWKASFTEP